MGGPWRTHQFREDRRRPRTGRILGAHALGPQASLLIQPLISAMTFDLRAADMARGQFWIHPALTEVVENALLGLGRDR
jgi:mycothione reductase